MIFQRAMAVLAAAFLVGAFALAAIGSPDFPLGAALYMLHPRSLYVAQAHMTAWLWSGAAMPLLVRPAWLLPACIGIVCAGVSLTIASSKGAQRSPRRRL
jgi:hypothetical protein